MFANIIFRGCSCCKTNVDYKDRDLNKPDKCVVSSALACQSLCTKYPMCAGFVWHGLSGGHCAIKGRLDHPFPNEMVISGPRTCTGIQRNQK